MKKTLVILAALATAGSVYAQGTISFLSFNGEVKRPDGTGASDGFTAGLFLNESLTDASAPLITSTFISGTGFISPPSSDAVVPGHPVNDSSATYVVRAWATSAGSFSAAKSSGATWGQSQVFNSGPLGGPNPPNPAVVSPTLDSGSNPFQTFTMVPEPTTYALGALAVGALLLRRRK
jgi:hypothetical protein